MNEDHFSRAEDFGLKKYKENNQKLSKSLVYFVVKVNNDLCSYTSSQMKMAFWN